MSDTSYIVRSTPKSRHTGAQVCKLLAENSRGVPFELVGKSLGCISRISGHEQVNVVRHDLKRFNDHIDLLRFFIQKVFQSFSNFTGEYIRSVLWTPNEVIFECKDGACAGSRMTIRHRTIVLICFKDVKCITKERLTPFPNSPVA